MQEMNDNGQESMCGNLSDAKLYGILDMGYLRKENLEQAARDLIAGGAGVLQLRAKGLDAGEVYGVLEKYAPDMMKISEGSGVPFIVNDYPEVAVAVGASGVHVGQDDGSLEDVRRIVGDGMIVGRSTHSVDQAEAALAEGFDYIGFGPLFPTPTKQGRPGIGLEDIESVMLSVGQRIPVFCIGGIKPDNLELVLASGARRVVIVSALLMAENIKAATQSVSQTLHSYS